MSCNRGICRYTQLRHPRKPLKLPNLRNEAINSLKKSRQNALYTGVPIDGVFLRLLLVWKPTTGGTNLSDEGYRTATCSSTATTQLPARLWSWCDPDGPEALPGELGAVLPVSTNDLM